MGVLLILTLTFPGAQPQSLPVGLMVNDEACQVAGVGMAAVLEAGTPGMVVDWTCLQAIGGEA
jgi:hypothetical protein